MTVRGALAECVGNEKRWFSPLPLMKPSKTLEFHIAERKRELPVC